MQQGAPRHILAPRSQDRAMPTGLNLTGKPMQLLLTLMSSGAQVLEQVGASPHQAQHLRPLPVGLRLAPGHLPSGTSSERGMAFHVHCVLLRSRWLLRGLDVHHELHVPRACSGFGPVHHAPAEPFFPEWSPSKRRHSLPWNEFLAQDPGRTWPVLHNIMAMVLPSRISTPLIVRSGCELVVLD